MEASIISTPLLSALVGMLISYLYLLLAAAALPPSISFGVVAVRYVFAVHPHGIHCWPLNVFSFFNSAFYQAFPGMQVVGVAMVVGGDGRDGSGDGGGGGGGDASDGEGGSDGDIGSEGGGDGDGSCLMAPLRFFILPSL